MMKNLLITAFVLAPTFSLAAAPPPNCTPVRQAKADVVVKRLYWTQDQGNYKLKSEIVCKNTLNVGVLPGLAAGCLYPIIADCPITIDGEVHKITASGLIFQNNDLGVPTKHFTASYHLDRNSNLSNSGESSSADIYTADLSLKNIGIAVQSKLDGPSPKSATQSFRDAILVTVDYGDTDAP